MKNKMYDLSWSQLTQWRSECGQRFGSIHDLPIIDSPHEEFKTLLDAKSVILDIGAGVHKSLQALMSMSTQQYFSLDVDPAVDFDFDSFDEIPEELKFDLMVAHQVLEHLTIAEALEMLSSAFDCLADDGRLLATVPNPAHPVRQWGDITHLTSWSMSELYSLFRNTGFQVISMSRYNKYPLPRNPVKRIIVNIVCEVFRIDWCDSLMIVGQRSLTVDKGANANKKAIPKNSTSNRRTNL